MADNPYFDAAIAYLHKNATPEVLDALIRQIAGQPDRPEGDEPLKGLFGYAEATDGSKAANESTRTTKFDPDNIDWHDMNCRVSEFFTVGEVTRYDPRRIPDASCIPNVLKLAEELDRIRDEWGGPIGVTSWHRPPAINAAVGGATQSQHLTGGAADIYPMDGDIHKFQSWLDKRWGGALGYGAYRGFVHVDIRNGGFDWGPGTVRWDY